MLYVSLDTSLLSYIITRTARLGLNYDLFDRRRYGTVEEMANIVNFLMGPESAYITGQAIEADGMWAI